MPLPAALSLQGVRILRAAHQHDDALVARGAALKRHTVQLSEQLLKIRLITGVFAGIACGVNARAASQRVHFDARIIRERWQQGCASGVASLDERVVLESAAALDGCLDA